MRFSLFFILLTGGRALSLQSAPSVTSSSLPSLTPLKTTGTSIGVLTQSGSSVVPVATTVSRAPAPFPSSSSQSPVLGVYPVSSPNHPPPVEDPALVPDFAQAWTEAYKKAKAKVATWSLEKKVSITTGVGWENYRCVGNIAPIDDFPGLCLEDGPLGVRLADFVTAFPAAINAASTWRRSLIRALGVAMGQEHVGKGVNVALGPMMNIGRIAQGGRNWEGFGADPFLAGVGAYETILGMQSTEPRTNG